MLFKIRSVYFTAAISAVLTVAAVASANYKASGPEINFHAKGPGGLAINGKSTKLLIDEDDKTITFKSFLNTMDTGIGKRNDHMQERFNAAKYPEITLTVPKDKVSTKGSGTVSGTLTFHGKPKPVTVTYSVKDGKVEASFNINVADYGIDPEKDLCRFQVCAKPDVSIDVHFSLS